MVDLAAGFKAVRASRDAQKRAHISGEQDPRRSRAEHDIAVSARPIVRYQHFTDSVELFACSGLDSRDTRG